MTAKEKTAPRDCHFAGLRAHLYGGGSVLAGSIFFWASTLVLVFFEKRSCFIIDLACDFESSE